MKILYSVGNRHSVGPTLPRILNALPNHEIKVAGYLTSTYTITHVDWVLDALHTERKNVQDILGENAPALSKRNCEVLVSEIENYNPDLIICDCEPIVARAANVLSKRLWYCSPIHLIDGIFKKRNMLKFTSMMVKYRNLCGELPKAEKKFIYSPFGCLDNPPKLKDEFEWLAPYHSTQHVSNNPSAILSDQSRQNELQKILSSLSYNVNIYPTLYPSNWLFCGGETSYISDAIYSGIPLCIAPSLKDPEALLNALLCEHTATGYNLGQVELMKEYSVAEIEKTYNNTTNQTIVRKNPFLHEKVESLCT